MITQNIDRIVTKKDFEQTSKLAITTIFRTLQGEGPYTGWPAIFVRFAGCNFGNKTDYCKFCFPPSAEIQTPTGKKKFGDIKLGDKLFTLDEDGNITETTVTNVLNRAVDPLDMVRLKIDIDGSVQTLTCTKDHPINTSNRGFVPAGDLERSDRIVHVKPKELGNISRSSYMTRANPMFNAKTAAKVTKTRNATIATSELTAFKRNGAKLISKTFGLVSSQGRLKNSDGQVDVVNFSCHPYNTFLVKDIHTHNCDTSFQLDQATWYTVDELVAEIGASYRSGDVLVITGGEPTLQPLLPAFMLAASKALGIEIIQIESNGTQAFFYAAAPKLRKELSEQGTLLSLIVSPKANETVGRYGKLSDTVIENASYIKFVLSADPASAHHTVPEWAPKHKLYVSPMAEYKKAYQGEISSLWDHDLIDAIATQRNYAYAAQYAIKHDIKLSVQTHLFTAIP